MERNGWKEMTRKGIIGKGYILMAMHGRKNGKEKKERDY